MKRIIRVLGCTLCLAVAAHTLTANAQEVVNNGVVNNGQAPGQINTSAGDVKNNANLEIEFASNTTINQTTGYVGSSNATATSDSCAKAFGGEGGNSDATARAYGGEGGDGGDGGEGGTGVGFGGESDSYSTSNVNVNYKTRTGVVSPVSPYLPYWNHGGWGRSEAFYANGPTEDKSVYERSFNPKDPEDMDQLRRMLKAVPYQGLLSILPGVFNQIGLVFGGTDKYHHGRGFQIANSLVRERRPEGKPLMVLYTDEIDRRVFKKANYAYVGKVSIEGHQNRNWDQVYSAAIAEVLPWDVDVLIIDGGMKGVSVGTNSSFPNGAAGFSQVNYSLSLLGGKSSGVTEAKGKPMISAEAFRYSPRLQFKRSVSRQFYNTLRSRFPELQTEQAVSYVNPTGGSQGIHVRPEIYQMAGFAPNQKVDCMSVPQTQK